MHAFSYIFFSFQTIFYILSNLKILICTGNLCNKKYRSPCSFKREEHLGARGHVRALITRKSCAVGMRNAMLRNHLKRQKCQRGKLALERNAVI